MPVLTITHRVPENQAVRYSIRIPKRYPGSPSDDTAGLAPLKLVAWGPKFQSRRQLGNVMTRARLFDSNVLADVGYGGGLARAAPMAATNISATVSQKSERCMLQSNVHAVRQTTGIL